MAPILASMKKSVRLALLFSMLLAHLGLSAAPETFATGAFIINMGITPQTVNNGLKPYGLVYALVKTHKVPVRWVITPGKAKDGIDFTHNSVTYRGGAFIVPVEYRTPAVNATIATWTGMGVVGATTVSSLTVDVYTTLLAMPEWSLDKKNGSIAVGYFTNAGIPATAYGGTNSNNWPNPADLDCCDDLFVMPHADPTWATHQNLLNWNLTCKGSIWLACHAGSALENMFNPGSPATQTNFLAEKTGNASGGGPYFQNALLLWGNHSDGTLPPPYLYDWHDDPIMQFMGIIDAATQNGSEQIYIPTSAGWRASTKIGVWDSDHPQRFSAADQHRAAVLAYGRGFGSNLRGFVMLEAAHSHNKASAPANIAAQRAFFNFSFYSTNVKVMEVAPTNITATPNTFNSGTPVSLTYTFPMGVNPADYTPVWTSSCGGTFSPNNTSQTVTWTPPAVGSPSACVINVEISNFCNKTFVLNEPLIVNPCVLTFNNTITNVACNGQSNGSIAMSISGSAGPFNWNWSRVSPAGTAMGAGTTISGLSAGTYNVTVTAPGGCSGTFSALVTQPVVLAASAIPANYLCFGQTGSINLTATGGTPAYTYDWADIPGAPDPEDRSGLTFGAYTVTVTDANNCTVSTSATITGPASAVSPSATTVNVACFGGSTGSIDLSVSGGTPGYTYNWSNGAMTQDISSLAAGTYTVTVTDANGCTATLSRTITQPPALTLSVLKTDPTCPPGGNPPLNADGTIDLTVSGGTGPYTYDWADIPGASDPEDRTGLPAGMYSVTVTDTNGCTAMTSVTLVNLNALPNAPVNISN